MDNIKITIITVCYNAGKIIEETIQSVRNQSYQNIEYIIIDGKSTDNTVNIIKDYADIMEIIWISEEDQGIYDAMNKGIDMATGDYIQFLNAGDILYNQDVVMNVTKMIAVSDSDVFYGNIIYNYSNSKEELRKYGKWCSKKVYFLTGDCINHQAIFARRIYLIHNPFNLNYTICADREWMMKIKAQKAKFKNIDIIICKYSLDENSASIKEKDIYDTEARRCIKENLILGYPIWLIFYFCRKSKFLSKCLHSIYKIIFIERYKM